MTPEQISTLLAQLLAQSEQDALIREKARF